MKVEEGVEMYNSLKKKMAEIQNEIEVSSLSQESSSSSPSPDDQSVYGSALTPEEIEMLESGRFLVFLCMAYYSIGVFGC